MSMRWIVWLCGMTTLNLLGQTASFQPETTVIDIAAPEVIDVDLRDVPPVAAWQPGDGTREVPKHRNTAQRNPTTVIPQVDQLAVRQAQLSMRNNQRAFETPDLNFDGFDFTGASPPDTVGDVGMNYYIQAVNSLDGSLYMIHNKSDGSIAAGPLRMSDLGSGTCGSGFSDPIILYDQLAQRWFISEIGASTTDLCLYVSQSSDPIIGGWFAYSFAFPNVPDYPKYGVSQNSYLISSNETGNVGDVPPAIYAVNRLALLAGTASQLTRTTIPPLAGFGFQTLTPADLEGMTTAPTGSPLIYMRHRDDEAHGGNTAVDYLDIFEYEVDWSNPSAATVSDPISIPISDFDSDLCGLVGFQCMDQPSGLPIDPIREVIMHRLTYRNFGSYEVLLGNFVTDVDGTDRAGVRWFELRRTGGLAGSWQLYQEGTVSFDDTFDRFIGAIAMDGSGNIALAYNVSGSTLAPSLRYVGRLSSDPLGVMTQGEHVIVDGSASNGGTRYGDYAAMSVDPELDCTFWFTGQFNRQTNWSTRIAAFEFDSCGCDAPVVPGNFQIVAGAAERSVMLSWNAVADAASYDIYRIQGACGDAFFGAPLATGVTATSFEDQTPSGSISYSYQVVAVSAEDCASQASNCVSVTPTGDCSLAPLFAGASGAQSADQGVCAVEVTWQPGTAQCPAGDLVYNVYRATTAGFTPATVNRIASCVSGTSYRDETVMPGVPYFYIVRAEDRGSVGVGSCGGNEESNLVEVSGAAFGEATVLVDDDLEGGTDNFTTAALAADESGNPFVLTTITSNSPINSYFCRNETVTKDQVLILQQQAILGPGELAFYHRYNVENRWDGCVLEYSLDGNNFVDILAGTGQVSGNSERFLENGYNGTLNVSNSTNPLAGREAWTGDSLNFVLTRVDVSDFVGQTVTFRWRLGNDNITGIDGWYLDDFRVSYAETCQVDLGCKSLLEDAGLWPEESVLDLVACVNLLGLGE